MLRCMKTNYRRTTMIRSDLPRASRIVAGGAAFAAALALNCAGLSAARAELGSVGRLLVGQRLDFVCVRLEGKSPLSCVLCKGWRIELSNVSDLRDGFGKGRSIGNAEKDRRPHICRKLFQPAVQYRRRDPYHRCWRQPERALVRRGRNGVVHFEKALSFVKGNFHLAQSRCSAPDAI